MADFFKKVGKKFDALGKHKMNALAHFNVPVTPDEEFQAAASTFYALRDHIVVLVESAEQFLKQIKNYSKAMEAITQGFASAMTAEDGDQKPQCDAAAATQVVFDFTTKTQEDCVNWFVKNVLDHLRAKKDGIKALEKDIQQRQQLKEEYDYYYEKVRKLREKSDSAKMQEKISRNEPKLEEAKEALKKTSLPLIALFHECQALRRKIVAHEYQGYKRCQKLFFGTGAEKFGTLSDDNTELIQLPNLQTDVDMDTLQKTINEQSAEASASVAGEKVAEEVLSSPAESETPAPAKASIELAADREIKTTGTDKSATAEGDGTRAVALFDFEPSAEDELKLTAGQELIVHVQNEGGWWEGETNGEVGLFPASYVTLQK